MESCSKRRIILATPTPVPAPAPKSGGALKIILIILGVFLALAILVFGALFYVGYHIAHSISHSANGKTTMSAFGSTVTSTDSGSLTAADLGTDIYPGATPTQGGSKMGIATASVVTGAYLTSDSVSQVEAFYKDKLGGGISDFNFGGTAMLTRKVSDKESVMVTVTNKPDQNGGKTKIVIQHTKSK
jgi:hypothetical protein